MAHRSIWLACRFLRSRRARICVARVLVAILPAARIGGHLQESRTALFMALSAPVSRDRGPRCCAISHRSRLVVLPILDAKVPPRSLRCRSSPHRSADGGRLFGRRRRKRLRRMASTPADAPGLERERGEEILACELRLPG